MNYGTINIYNEDGKSVSKNKVGFWNAWQDEEEPGLCITISGKELLKLLSVKLPKDPLLQIILPIEEVKGII